MQTAWSGYRKFYIERKVPEPGAICSFYLKPRDGGQVAPFEPGQFLTFRLQIPGQAEPVIRCYSLSESPLERGYYRVTIKKAPPPPDRPELPHGMASSFFHDRLEVGDELDIAAPSGHFYMDQKSENPVVLIGGGVGLTPMLSMLNTIVLSGGQRRAWFFYGVRNRPEHAMAEHLRDIAERCDNVEVVICYSEPTENCRLGEDYHVEGFISVDLFKKMLPPDDYEFFVCGPPPMMSSITGGLKEWGIADENINFEAFGPATVKEATVKNTAAEPARPAEKANVTFKASGKTVTWNGGGKSILDLAEQNGIEVASGCRAGNCGTCATTIVSGKVKYLSEPGNPPDDGVCLLCITVPDGDLTINI